MITRIYCPICNKLEFQLKYKTKESWYGNCENCKRYIEGSHEPNKYNNVNFQIDYILINKMEEGL